MNETAKAKMSASIDHPHGVSDDERDKYETSTGFGDLVYQQQNNRSATIKVKQFMPQPSV